MLRYLKYLIKGFLTLSKGEQRAIILLLIFVLLLSVFNYFLPQLITGKYTDHSKFINQVEAFREEQQKISDSIEIERLQNRGELDFSLAQQKLKPFKFDPNNLPEESWKKLGLTDKQIRVIKNYEKKGGSFVQKEDLKRMYCISDAEYKVLEPYIVIKSPFKTITENQPVNKKKTRSRSDKPVYKVVELNSATDTALSKNLHLPFWLAERIVKYRNLLGGYAFVSQLAEVYGFDSSYLGKIKDYITIDKTGLKQIDLNNAGFKEILHHPYISYEITKEIVNYRDEHNGFLTTDELTDSDIISESLFIKLSPYLTVKPANKNKNKD